MQQDLGLNRYFILIDQLLAAHSESEILSIAEENHEIIEPNLHMAINSFLASPGNEIHLQSAQYIYELISTTILENAITIYINQQEHSGTIKAWLFYLVCADACAIWEQILNAEENKQYSKLIKDKLACLFPAVIGKLYIAGQKEDIVDQFGLVSSFISLIDTETIFERTPAPKTSIQGIGLVVIAIFLMDNRPYDRFMVEYLQLAKRVIDPRQFMEEWQVLMVNLANLFLHIVPHLPEHIEQAKLILEEAIPTFSVHPNKECWRLLNISFGRIHFETAGDHKSNCLKAITYYQEALRLVDEDSPEDLVLALMGIANCYGKLTSFDNFDYRWQNVFYMEYFLNLIEENNLTRFQDELLTRKQHAYCLINNNKAEGRLENLSWAIESFEKYIAYCMRLAEKYLIWSDFKDLALVYMEHSDLNQTYYDVQVANYFNKALDDPTMPDEDRYECIINLAAYYRGSSRGVDSADIHGSIALLNTIVAEDGLARFPELHAKTKSHLLYCMAVLASEHKGINLDLAISYGNQALLFYDKKKYPQEFSSIHRDLGNAYYHMSSGDRLNNLIEALRHFRLSSTAVFIPSDAFRLSICIVMCLISLSSHASQSEVDTEIDQIQRLIDDGVLEELGPDQYSTFFNLSFIFMNRGQIGRNRDEDIQEAISWCDMIIREATSENQLFVRSDAYYNKGCCLLELQEHRRSSAEQAIVVLKQSLLGRALKRRPLQWAASQNALGVAYLNASQLATDFRLQLAAQCLNDSLLVFSISETAKEYFEANCNLGMTYFHMASFGRAVGCFKNSYHALESLRQQASFLETRGFIDTDNVNLYGFMVESLLKIGSVEEALTYCLEAKDRLSLNHLAKLKDNPNSAAKDNEGQLLLDQLWKKIKSVESEIADLAQDQAIDNTVLKGKYLELKFLHDERIAKRSLLKLNTISQEQHLLLGTYISLEDVSKLCASREFTLVEYFYLPITNKWVAFVVNASSVRIVELYRDTDKTLHEFREWLSYHSMGLSLAMTQEKQENLFTSLYDYIILPLKLPKTGNVVFSAYKELFMIPFSILRNNRSGDYLYNELSIYCIGSLTAYLSKDRSGLDNRDIKECLLIGHAGHGEELLQHTEQEIQLISSMFQSKDVLYGKQARPEAVVEMLSGANYRFIHFACHTQIAPLQNDQSSIVLEGRLYSEDITSSVTLKGDTLVVLGSCQSAVGEEGKTIDLTSFTQTWLDAGASHVIGSLWKVEDNATMKLFKNFYVNVTKDSKTIHSSLRTAMNLLAREPGMQSPFFWGGFQLYGLPQTINYYE